MVLVVIAHPTPAELGFKSPIATSMYAVFIDEIPSVELVEKARRYRKNIVDNPKPNTDPRDVFEALRFLDHVIEYCKFSGVPVTEGVDHE